MIITCPHCRTQYQVTFEAIGSAGRKVQCAQCQEAWQQAPLPSEDQLTPEDMAVFDAVAEDGLDEALAAEERAVAAEVEQKVATERRRQGDGEDANRTAAAKVDPAAIRSRQRDFSRRRRTMEARLPLARLRRATRIGAALALVGMVGAFGFLREPVVGRFPDLAGVYEAVGLGVNVVGLEFSDVATLHSLRNGKDMLTVSAQIVGVTPEPRLVPPVVVSLLDGHGQAIYEWSVTPAVRDLMAGERASFDTQLLTPPPEAARVRLSFAGGTGAAPGEAAEPAAAPAHTPPEHAPAPAAAPDAHSEPEHH